jgi:hypothetical protein
MIKWLIRPCVALVLLGCVACGGQTSKIPTGKPNPTDKMEKPPAPPALPKPPPDAPRR